jgi:hypothetical protein
MKRFLTAGLLALALAASGQQQARASGCGPFGFTVGFGASFSFCISPYQGCGTGCCYPGYGCCSKMLPAYAYLGDGGGGYDGHYGYGEPVPQHAPAAPSTKPSDSNPKNTYNPGYYSQPGFAYYPPAGYGPSVVPAYWYGR